jgi:hypothetical protein
VADGFQLVKQGMSMDDALHRAEEIEIEEKKEQAKVLSLMDSTPKTILRGTSVRRKARQFSHTRKGTVDHGSAVDESFIGFFVRGFFGLVWFCICVWVCVCVCVCVCDLWF